MRYKIKTDHWNVNVEIAKQNLIYHNDKKNTIKVVRWVLHRWPFVKVHIQKLHKLKGVKNMEQFRPHETYEMRRSKKTGRLRMVKL